MMVAHWYSIRDAFKKGPARLYPAECGAPAVRKGFPPNNWHRVGCRACLLALKARRAKPCPATPEADT